MKNSPSVDRISVYCDEHPEPHLVVEFTDRAAREPLADFDAHRGEWEASEHGEGSGDGFSGRWITNRNKTELICGHHAPRNRKPVQFSAGAEYDVLDVLAHARLEAVTLTELRIVRQSLAALMKRRVEGISEADVRRIGAAVRDMRAERSASPPE